MVNIGVFFEDGLYPTLLGVGNEHLSETGASYQADELFDTNEVEFIKHIVEQQNGLHSGLTADILKLSQLECQKIGLLLSLTAKLLYCIIGQQEIEVILVRSDCCVEQYSIALAALFELLGKRRWLIHLTEIPDLGSLCSFVGYEGKIFLKQGLKLFEESTAGFYERLPVDHQLIVPKGDSLVVEIAVFVALFEEMIALLDGFLILKQVLKVSVVGLGDDAIHELASHLAASKNEILVAGGNNH